MKSLVIFCLLSLILWEASTLPQPEREPLQGIKGGVKGGSHQSSQNATIFYGGSNISSMRNISGASSTFKNETVARNYEKGVCYEEVLTITLVNDKHNVPAGNGSTPEYSKIRKCCPGYERNVHNRKICDPVCEHECVNAKCIAPNVCACYADHVLNLDGYCVTTCPIGCLNGHCGPDKECVCDHGYTEEPNMKFCIPKCSKGCLHGNCTAPEVCTCESGFEIGKDGVCVPKCDKGCMNGDCTAPNVCICKPGYEKDQLGQCSPVCPRGCQQGKCIAPNTCSCADGFTMDETNTICIPQCIQQCLNGDCTGPNECTCRKGYVKDVKDPTGTKCVGNCPNGCPNGICSGPNLCLCLPGYVKNRGVKGSQLCVKRSRRSLPHHLKMLIP